MSLQPFHRRLYPLHPGKEPVDAWRGGEGCGDNQRPVGGLRRHDTDVPRRPA